MGGGQEGEVGGVAASTRREGEGGGVEVCWTAEGKGSGVAAVAPAGHERADAVALVRAASVAMGGKGGGGRRDMAQAGGPDGEAADAAFAAVREALKELA